MEKIKPILFYIYLNVGELWNSSTKNKTKKTTTFNEPDLNSSLSHVKSSLAYPGGGTSLTKYGFDEVIC